MASLLLGGEIKAVRPTARTMRAAPASSHASKRDTPFQPAKGPPRLPKPATSNRISNRKLHAQNIGRKSSHRKRLRDSVITVTATPQNSAPSRSVSRQPDPRNLRATKRLAKKQKSGRRAGMASRRADRRFI